MATASARKIDPIHHASRSRGATLAARRRANLHPFLRWLGATPVGRWAEAHVDPAGKTLTRARVVSYYRDAETVAAPEWFRRVVFAESAGAVPIEAWKKSKPRAR